MVNLTGQEKETIICFNESDKEASVFTFNKALIRKMQELKDEYPDDVSFLGWTNEEMSGEWTVPKKWVKVRGSKKMTEEQREIARANLSKALNRNPVEVSE